MKLKYIAKQALVAATKMLIGSDWWDRVRATAEKLQSSDLDGDEKRALAVMSLREAGWDLAGFLLNLALEVAVALLNDESAAPKIIKKAA